VSDRLEMDRRSFIERLGGGILVIVSLGPDALLAQQRRRAYPTDVNAYLRIGEDGRVTVFSGKIEMGQGVMTSQAQMLAEELGVSLESIEMVLGDTDRCPWDMGTFGSLTTRMFGPALRAAGAEARAVLLQLASEQLGLPGDRLVAANGVVSAKDDPSRSVSYGQLAKGQAITRTLDRKAVLRSVSEFTVMGQSPLRLDARDKVTGAAKYAGDVRLPGMLCARVLRPPAHGAKLVAADTSAAAKLPGVVVVNEPDLVAVLHADPEAAAAALAHVKAEWTPAPPGADQDGIFDELVAKAPAPAAENDGCAHHPACSPGAANAARNAVVGTGSTGTLLVERRWVVIALITTILARAHTFRVAALVVSRAVPGAPAPCGPSLGRRCPGAAPRPIAGTCGSNGGRQAGR